MMLGSGQVFDPHRAAVHEVQRVLQHPDDLKRLPAFLENKTREQQANKAQLTATVASQVDEARAGIAALDEAQQHLTTMQNSYRDISELCNECSSLIENHDKIRVLSAVHYNLGKTLQDVSNISDLPAMAEDAEKLLSNNELLLQAFETLSLLEGTSNCTALAIESGTRLRSEDKANLDYYFDKVKTAMQSFEKRLWKIIRDFALLARTDPAQLVLALRVVELQEKVDAQLKDSAAGVLKPKRYKRQCLTQVDNSIVTQFADLQKQCSQLLTAEANTDSATDDILKQAQVFVEELASIYDHVVPCFPPSYKIFTTVFRQYHKQLDDVLYSISCCTANLANNDILKVVRWASDYQATLQDLGIEEEDTKFPSEDKSGLNMLMEKYITGMRTTRQDWLKNIIKADLAEEPKLDKDGFLRTPGTIEFFRLVNDDVAVVEEIASNEFLLLYAQAVLEAMHDFQEPQRAQLSQSLNEEVLCAAINNNAFAYEAATDFQGRLEEVLGDSVLQGQADPQCRGFLDLAKQAMACLVGSFFAEPSVAGLTLQVHASPMWLSGQVTRNMVATLSDFLGDYGPVIIPRFLQMLTELFLEETIAIYAASFLSRCKEIKGETIAAMEQDSQSLAACFSEVCRQDKVLQVIQLLDRLRQVAACQEPDDLLQSYVVLLQIAPGITPTFVERIIAARADMKGHRNELMVTCKEAYTNYLQHNREPQQAPVILNTRAQGAATPAAAPGTPVDRNAALFTAALQAVKRKPAL